MGRYDSPGQIFGLFAGAALVAVGVIFVLNVEASKRYGQDDEIIAQEKKINPTPSLAARLLNKLGNLGSWFKSGQQEDSEGRLRQKRSIIDDQEENDLEEDEPIIFPNTQLSENLLSQSLNGHKIRNVANKVKHLDSINDQIVLEILRQFCPTTLQEPRNDSSVFYEEALQESLEDLQDEKSDTKETDLNVTISNLNATKIHLQFKENTDLKKIETVFVCEDYGNTVITVLITTAVNLSFAGFILLCRRFINSWPQSLEDYEDEMNCCNISYGHQNLQEEYYDDEIYGISTNNIQITDTPIIKNNAFY